MKPPIPAPDSTPSRISNWRVAPKPAGLTTAILLLLLFAFVYFLFAQNNVQIPTSLLPLYGIYLIFWLCVCWFFWKGRNWARIIVMIGAIITIIFLPSNWASRSVWWEQAVSALDALFSLVLLWWLSRHNIAAFWKNNGTLPQLH